MGVVLNGRSWLSLAELEELILQQGEFEVGDDEFIKPTELHGIVNMALSELHDMLADCFQDYFLASTMLFVDGANDGKTALLPADFQRAVKVFYLYGGRRIAIDKFDLEHMTDSNTAPLYTNLPVFTYRILGETVHFDPTPPAGRDTFELWYVPRYQWLEDPADRIHMSVPIGWLDFVIADVVARLLAKEESDPSYWMARKMEAKQRIIEFASQRDAGKSFQIIDVSTGLDYDWPW